MDAKSIAHYAIVAVNLDGTFGEIVRRDATLSALAHSDIDPGFFPITFITKDDIRGIYQQQPMSPENIEEIISGMTDYDMMELASDMGDDYVNQLYWSSMEILFEEKFEKCFGDMTENDEDEDEDAQYEKDLKRCSD